MIIYTTLPQDTLYKIANKYGTTISAIVGANAISNPDKLAIGQNLIIPVDNIKHIAKRGDTLYNISKYYDVPLDKIIEANKDITNPNNIYIGQAIYVPYGITPSRSAEINGYAIANISQRTISQIVPSLTYMAIFSYQVRADGSMYTLYEQNVINEARASTVAPLMVITNIGESGGFDSDLGHTILNDESVQNTLTNNILSTLQEKNYYGVDVDFEFLYPEDRDAYIAFLRKLKDAISPYGYTLSVAVAPKYRDNQPGILYEAHDYYAIGQIADRVIIMTYEWGYVYGAPQAIAPYNEVREVISYAVTRIAPNKILMGVPNYAYDWTLPFSTGDSAETLTNNQAIDRAIQYGANIEWDDKAKSPYYNYIDNNGKTHVVWFEDARSYQAKTDIVRDYHLAGMSIWTVNNYFAPLYGVINNNFDVIRVIE